MPSALVFDCDGVILDSATLKRDAFAALYDDQPRVIREAVRAYLERRGGQPREVKFQHIEGQILGRPPSNQRIETLCRCFRTVVAERIAQAHLIGGALATLQHWHGQCPLILLSATPQRELDETVEQHALTLWFDEVIGAPPDKVTALGNLLVRRQLPPSRTVMIGDSYNDFRAARSNGTAFIGVVAADSDMPFPSDTAIVSDLYELNAQLKELLGQGSSE
ncbi:haloacid dehalogenase [Halomonas huangheensis]|nr:haloacid dehalogenase [Halomonas huangheensis]